MSDPGILKVLPVGYEPKMQKPEFPMQGFDAFDRSLNGEIGAGMGIPSGVMLADTSQYNYSSFRGELQNYWTYIAEIQQMLCDRILDRQFSQWFECRASFDPVFQRIYDQLDGRIHRLAREWQFPTPPSVDPLHDAQAYKLLYDMGAMSLRQICDLLGHDINDVKADRDYENKTGTAEFVDEIVAMMAKYHAQNPV